ADHGALTVTDRRYGHRRVERRAIFAKADSLEVFHGLRSANVFEDDVFLIEPLWRNQKGDGPPHGFLGGVAKQAFCAAIPTGDDAVEILADNGVVRRRDEGGQSGLSLLGLA